MAAITMFSHPMSIRVSFVTLLAIAMPAVACSQEIFQCSIDAGAASGYTIPYTVDIGDGTFMLATTWIDESFGVNGLQFTGWHPDGRVENSSVYRSGIRQALGGVTWT